MIRNLLLLTLLFSPAVSAQKVEVVNNQPFPIRLPWRLIGSDQAFVVDVVAKGTQVIDLTAPPAAAQVQATPIENGIALRGRGGDLGTLHWDVFVEKLAKKPTDKEAAQTRREFDKTFKPVPLAFKRSGNIWSAATTDDGLKLAIELEILPGDFVELRATVTNISAPQEKVYAAVLTRWTQPGVMSNKVGYDNRVIDLPPGGATPFRAGEGRHHFVQRGADWINTPFPGGGCVAWINDFAPSWTLHHEKKPKTPAHWSGANTAQLAQEAIKVGQELYSITEIARPNLKMYESRVTGNVLPDKDPPLKFTSLIIPSWERLSDQRVDELFVAYSSYNYETKTGDVTRLTFGVPHVKFGTAYFPFSTLGENFEKWHMPGMSKETYWPLAGDIVTNYKLFADDIRRDLRIAKAMGFESIRLHHLEVIDTLDRKVQDEFLDFFFAELKHVGLTALLDVKLPPARVVELVKKYRPQVDGVELDNEVLIFGINDEEVEGWKQTYAAVKAVAPDLPVWLTGHTNTGAFERLRKLGVPFDMVGQHAYMDSLDAIASGRNYALAMSDYGSEIGKPPVITEWNWRFLTRMTPEARAKVYPPIFENVLATRAVPIVYQFQFQESLAMTTRSLRGIRHYEQLNLSRRPRPEAFEFMKLIEKYGDPNSPQRLLTTKADRTSFTVTNHSKQKMSIRATPEGSTSVRLTLDRNAFDIEPGKTEHLSLRADAPADAMPGFYHVFVRFEANDVVSYAWAELRKTGPLKLDKGNSKYHPTVKYLDGALDYDFNRDIAIVYRAGRENESRWDVESAWIIYQTLEAATAGQ